MSSIVPVNIPFTPDVFEECVSCLAVKYPCMDVTVIGTSRKGYPIYSLVLGYGPVSYMYNAAHHANEWITAVLLTRFAEDCAKEIYPMWQSWAGGKQPNEPGPQSSWYERVTLHLVPMVNPDGVEMVAGGTGYDGWKANACGVDLNSNYPAGWVLAKAHKYARGYTAPGPRDYVGPKPLSEPESLAMAAYTRLVDPAMTLSLHTQGAEIYWRYRDYMPPGAEGLARRLSIVSGYKLEDVPDESSHAGYRDWFIEAFNRPGFTIECGLGESPLPVSDFDGIYKKVHPLMMEGLG
ncbi:MAG: M14 family metallocarboxypeptidase [Defluviitaleaceae bacterium]|nr:M14 family metallocarboxypeptidase [Defluviitaleaceae bacterium]